MFSFSYAQRKSTAAATANIMWYNKIDQNAILIKNIPHHRCRYVYLHRHTQINAVCIALQLLQIIKETNARHIKNHGGSVCVFIWFSVEFYCDWLTSFFSNSTWLLLLYEFIDLLSCTTSLLFIWGLSNSFWQFLDDEPIFLMYFAWSDHICSRDGGGRKFWRGGNFEF